MDNAIALQYQPTTALESPLNMMAKISAIRGSQQENAMRAAQMENYRSEVERRNAMLPYEQAKAQSDQETADLTRDTKRGELVTSELARSRSLLENVRTPEQFISWHQGNHSNQILGPWLASHGVTADQSRANIEAALQTPGGFEQLLNESKLGSEKVLESVLTEQDFGGGRRQIRTPKFGTGGATEVPGSNITNTQTPDSIARKREIEDKGDPETTIFGAPITDAAGNVHFFNKFGHEINRGVGIGMGKPTATFERMKAQREQLSLDVDTTISELERATAKGGLIETATGSGLGALRDIGAGFVGKGTEGSIAVGALKPIYDKVLKMVTRFEGPQSDKDTKSYSEAAGNLANPNTPTEVKLGAAKEILRIMKDRKAQFLTRDMAEGGGAPAAGADHSKMTDAELLSALGGTT